jgi:hypothetical protein
MIFNRLGTEHLCKTIHAQAIAASTGFTQKNPVSTKNRAFLREILR